ncbi:MAG: hypothetical protein JST93_28865 [Acidobacteria bacterium]|nr:hypothetical protein [Acidobacteriota bacterium]
MKRLLMLACLAGVAIAQQRATVSAHRILTEAEENYCTCAMPSLEVEANVVVEQQSALENSTNRYRISTYFLPSNNIRIDRDGENWRIELTNGTEMAQFGPQNYRYRAKTPQRWAEGIRPDEFPGTHWLIYDSLTPGATNIRLKGEETLTVAGQRVPCYVIEYDRTLQYRDGMIMGKTTVWIGKQEKYVFKEISTRPPMPPGDPGDGRIDKLPMRRTVVVTKLNVSTPPSEALFDLAAVASKLPKDPEPMGITISGGFAQPPLAPQPPAPSSDYAKARSLLAGVATNYNAAQTYRGRHVQVFDQVSPQGRRQIRMPVDVLFRRPGQWRLTFEQTGDVWIQDRAQPDGYWQYWPKRNLYWRSSFTQFLRSAEMLYEDLADNLESARILPDETIQADGRSIRCTVVEAHYSQPLNILQHETLYSMGGTYKLWIDPGRKLVVQWQNGPLLETLAKAEVDVALPDAEFRFQPPAGATLYKPF